MKNHKGRIALAASLASALATMHSGAATAQEYPSERITFVVGFAAGGFADSVARLVAEHVGEILGQTVVVENRAGAASNVAARAVASAEPDGYAVLASTTSLAVNATLYKDIDYSLMEDLVPVGIAVRAPETFSVNPSRPGTLAEFLEASKSGNMTYGSAGVGSGSHLTWSTFFDNVAKVPVAHVPFQGGAPAMQAVIGGQVDGFAATASGNIVSQVSEGNIRCLAVAAPERYKGLPDCPTLAEQGFPDHYGSSWIGFWVPAGTPDDVVQKLNEAINSIADDPEAAESLARHGDMESLDAAEAADFVRSEVEVWGERVEAAGAQVQ